jgi:hypothetical protein
MCEFCADLSEGRKWYLKMKRYSAELLNARPGIELVNQKE